MTRLAPALLLLAGISLAAQAPTPSPQVPQVAFAALGATSFDAGGLRLRLDFTRTLIPPGVRFLEVQVENPSTTGLPFILSELALVDNRGVQPSYTYLGGDLTGLPVAYQGRVAPGAHVGLKRIQLSDSLQLPIRVYYGATLLAEVTER